MPKPISPTFDSRLIEGDLPASRSAREAFKRVGARLEKLHAAEDALNADRTLTEAARSAQIHELRSKVADAIKPVLEAEHARVGEALEGAERKIDERLYSGHKTASREEIRRHVASLPAEKRFGFVRERAKAGDSQTAAAVLTAPSYLSGLDDSGQKSLRDVIVSEVAPDLAAERSELRRVSERIEAAAKAFEGAYAVRRTHAASAAAKSRAEAVAAASDAA